MLRLKWYPDLHLFLLPAPNLCTNVCSWLPSRPKLRISPKKTVLACRAVSASKRFGIGHAMVPKSALAW